MMSGRVRAGGKTQASPLARLRKSAGLYLLILPGVIYLLIYQYGPMVGVTVAFKEYSARLGIFASPWVGLKYFERFVTNYQFSTLVSNTLLLSLYNLVLGFPIPILFSLLLNYVRSKRFKKVVQTISYAPHFISVVVLVGMVGILFAPVSGILSQAMVALGGRRVMVLTEPGMFRHLYVISNIWQEMGWNSIIYIAALASIDPALHEAAIVDGANKLKRILHIDLPGIFPTIVTLLILNTGKLMSVGFEKAFLMQNNLNLPISEIISTYVYKVGLQGAQFSYSAAIGLFNSAINVVLLVLVNHIARRLGENSLW